MKGPRCKPTAAAGLAGAYGAGAGGGGGGAGGGGGGRDLHEHLVAVLDGVEEGGLALLVLPVEIDLDRVCLAELLEDLARGLDAPGEEDRYVDGHSKEDGHSKADGHSK